MELLVRTFDKYTGADLHMNAKTTKRGDVIEVRDDGWPWGRCERKNPAFLLIRVNIPAATARAMKTAELGDERANPFLRIRAFHLDLDVLASRGHVVPNDETARQSRYPSGQDIDDYLSGPDIPILQISPADFQQARKNRTPLANPLVLGNADPLVLGG